MAKCSNPDSARNKGALPNSPSALLFATSTSSAFSKLDGFRVVCAWYDAKKSAFPLKSSTNTHPTLQLSTPPPHQGSRTSNSGAR
eukprot:CAMPEP_0171831426 /NCGR_PEP_ID=MMETSP0992-20121227/8768_1 /TAXON_ID=483369 /ORGANISM="non described non described, Strain CCMP2098" /LENGTH=84 /DNA_ID=CAMNT_0012446831 /DNA_START=60 /DNA_END=314 /DNA_ORIENTATION=+